jgi:hypothetical protein
MQPLMYDQPQPTCGRVENDSAERGGADHHSPQKDCLAKPPIWIGREHCPILLARMLASSILLKQASRPALGVSDFTRWGDRPEAGVLRPYFGADRGVYRFDGDKARIKRAGGVLVFHS